MKRAYVGVGANLGDPHKNLRAAAGQLDDSAGVKLVDCSMIYRSAPVGPPGQDDYLNGVLALDTDLSPTLLLETLHRIEDQAGRVRGERWGPRLLDLDLLIYEGAICEGKALTLPHPRIEERNFVLRPLADLVGEDWQLPGGRRLGDCLQECPANPLEPTGLGWSEPPRRSAGVRQ